MIKPSIIERFFLFIRFHCVGIVASTAVCLGFLGCYVPQLNIEHGQNEYDLGPGSATGTASERARHLFDEGSQIVIVLDAKNQWRIRHLQRIRQIGAELRALKGVRRVLTPLDARMVVWRNVWGNLIPIVKPAFPRTLTDNAEVERIRSDVSGHPAFSGRFASLDGGYLALVLQLDHEVVFDRRQGGGPKALFQELRAVLDRHEDETVSFRMVGPALVDQELQNILGRDLSTLGLIVLLAIVLFALAAFRSWRLAVLAIGLAMLSVVGGLGIISVSGGMLTLNLVMIIPVLLTLSLAYTTHYFMNLYFAPGPEDRGQGPLHAVLHRVWAPNVLSCVTTATGFGFLSLSDIQTVSDLGLYMAAGVLFVGFLTNLFLPALIQLMPDRFLGIVRARQPTLRLHLLNKLCGFTLSNRRPIVIFALLITLVSIGGLYRIDKDSNILNYLPPENALRQDFLWFDEKFGGVSTMDVVWKGTADDLKRRLPALEALEAALRAHGDIGAVLSPLTLIAPTAYFQKQASSRVHPATRWSARNWEGMAKGPGMRWLLATTGDRLAYRISMRTAALGAKGLNRVLAEVSAQVRAEGLEKEVEITGLVPVLLEIDRKIVSSQINSIALTVLVVFACLFFLSRNLWLGAAVVVANLVPVILVMGLMGWSNTPLDIATVMIATVSLGLIVDDTLHFIHRYRDSASATSEVQRMTSLVPTLGLSIGTTSLIIALGFLVLGLSNFVPLSRFGLLVAVTVAFALLADVILLPAVLVMRKKGKIRHRL
jgi:predicted RND superfamily exporter protein